MKDFDKITVLHKDTYDLEANGRCAIYIKFKMNSTDQENVIILTHLSVLYSPQKTNIKSLLNQMSSDKNIKDVKYKILMGDFNSYNREDYDKKMAQFRNIKRGFGTEDDWFESIDCIKNNMFMKDSFDVHSQVNHKEYQYPINTSDKGGRVDFIFMSPSFLDKQYFHILGSYVYYSDASDHLPVITDLYNKCTEPILI